MNSTEALGARVYNRENECHHWGVVTEIDGPKALVLPDDMEMKSYWIASQDISEVDKGDSTKIVTGKAYIKRKRRNRQALGIFQRFLDNGLDPLGQPEAAIMQEFSKILEVGIGSCTPDERRILLACMQRAVRNLSAYHDNLIAEGVNLEILGTRVYNRGNVCNQPHWGRVTQILEDERFGDQVQITPRGRGGRSGSLLDHAFEHLGG